MYKEMNSKAKKAIAMAKGRAYDNFYARLETKKVIRSQAETRILKVCIGKKRDESK